MSAIYECFCVVRGGKLDDYNRAELQRALKAYSGPAELVIRRPRRDARRNRKLHAVIGEIAEALGWEAGELKEELLRLLRPQEEDPVTGLMRRQKTSKMSDAEVEALVLEIQAWAVQIMPGFVFRYDHAA